jgi:hypothetical protein
MTYERYRSRVGGPADPKEYLGLQETELPMIEAVFDVGKHARSVKLSFHILAVFALLFQPFKCFTKVIRTTLLAFGKSSMHKIARY